VEILKKPFKGKFGGGPGKDLKDALDGKLKLSDEARKHFKAGRIEQAMSAHWEDLILRKVGGKKNVMMNGREIDVVTDTALIQAKRSTQALDKPANWLRSKSKKLQVTETIRMAKEQGKKAEFWFKYGVHPKVRKFVEDAGGIVIEGLGVN
jgi:hypothetical protein